MNLKLENEGRKMEEKFEREKNALHHKYRQEIADLENSISLVSQISISCVFQNFDIQTISEKNEHIKTFFFSF